MAESRATGRGGVFAARPGRLPTGARTTLGLAGRVPGTLARGATVPVW